MSKIPAPEASPSDICVTLICVFLKILDSQQSVFEIRCAVTKGKENGGQAAQYFHESAARTY